MLSFIEIHRNELSEVERLLDECTELPQVLVMENVVQVHSPKNIADFKLWIEKIESLGYKNYYTDLNARDFIPRCLSLKRLIARFEIIDSLD